MYWALKFQGVSRFKTDMISTFLELRVDSNFFLNDTFNCITTNYKNAKKLGAYNLQAVFEVSLKGSKLKQGSRRGKEEYQAEGTHCAYANREHSVRWEDTGGAPNAD